MKIGLGGFWHGFILKSNVERWGASGSLSSSKMKSGVNFGMSWFVRGCVLAPSWDVQKKRKKL